MKTKLLLIVLTLFAIVTSVRAQSPEEMQKMMDSMMQNVPEDQKAFIKQMMKKGQEADDQRRAKKEEAKKNQMAKNEAAKKRSEDEFYWRNTIASNTSGKFEKWPHGDATIKAKLYNRETKQFMDLELGTVSETGQITIQLPSIDFREWPRVPINKSSSEGDQMLVDTEHLEFSNTNVTYFSTRFDLAIYKGDSALGYLKIGNSIKPVVNLNAPCCFDKGGDGYTAHWVFMSQANTISGANESVSHNLQFKAGWNLVKVLVEGYKEQSSTGMVAGGPFWKNKFYTSTTTVPADAKYYFTSNQ